MKAITFFQVLLFSIALNLLWFAEAFAENSVKPAEKATEQKADSKTADGEPEEQGEQVVDLYKSMPKSSPKESISVKGVVVGIRSSPETEIFLKGAKSSVIIPKGRLHNSFLNKAIQSQRSGTEVNFTVDAKTMRIIEDAGNTSAEKAGQ